MSFRASLRIIRSVLVLALMCACVWLQSTHTFAQTRGLSGVVVKALFCAVGAVGLRPVPVPPDFEAGFAVAILEVESPRSISNVTVSGFVLLTDDGSEARQKRLVEVEEFFRDRANNEGEFAYYVNPGGGTRPWNGTLPAGRIRLRIRAAFKDAPFRPKRFRVMFGDRVVEGKVDGQLPS